MKDTNTENLTPVYIDVETNIKCPIGGKGKKTTPSPFWPDNKIVWTGYKTDNNKTKTLRGVPFSHKINHKILFVAQNAAFDMQYLMKESPAFMDFILGGGAVWDTMLAEYLLTGQQHTFASLDELATKYGGVLKPEGENSPKAYWEKGIDTEDIPEDVILPYLEGDVNNLEIIFKGQLKEAKELGMLPLIESQMAARVATLTMEYQGMAFDKERAQVLTEDLKDTYQKVENAVRHAMKVASQNNAIEEEDINPNSNEQVSAILFGGDIKVTRKVSTINKDGTPAVYKTGAKKGLPKCKNVTVSLKAKGLHKPKTVPNEKGYHPVGEKFLKAIDDDSGLVEHLLKLREYKKQISTYFEGYQELVYPDGCIHGTLNHCKTATGRLSSSSPNLQNVSGKESD